MKEDKDYRDSLDDIEDCHDQAFGPGCVWLVLLVFILAAACAGLIIHY